MKLFRAALTALSGIGALALAGSAFAQSPEVVMSGLDNPRGLAFALNGALYVAEAGRGGGGPGVPCAARRVVGERTERHLVPGHRRCLHHLGLGGGREFQEALGGRFSGNLIHMAVSGKWKVVADAGANALLRVAANGGVETLAVFPPLANSTGFGPPWIESVPTAVAVGADGAIYVTNHGVTPGEGEVVMIMP